MKMIKIVAVISLFALTGCRAFQETPIEQMQRSQAITAVSPIEVKPTETVTRAKKQKINQFECKKGVIIKVQQADVSKKFKASNERAIQLTYANRTHTLSPVVTKNGKKYSNIRWNWREDTKGKGVLIDNSNKILASECVLKTK